MKIKKNIINLSCVLLIFCMTFGCLTVFADEVSSVGYTLYQYSQVEEAIQAFESTKPELLEAYKQDFPTESGWWDEYAIMPILTGVISGYPDGTIKPNNPVTGGEFAKMIATAFFVDIESGGTVDNAEWAGKWYNNYYNVIAKAFPYFHSEFASTEFMETPMKRSEVAYVLAKIIDSEKLDTYIEKIENGDYSSMSEYTDFKPYLFTEDILTQNDITKSYVYDGEYQWKVAEELRDKYNIIPNNQMASIMMLKDIGVMVGDGEGHISPDGNVTRAEIFKLLNETCKATREWLDTKFFGWENTGLDFFETETITSRIWKEYTLDTVLNPESKKEQQYTIADLFWGEVDGKSLNPYELIKLYETEGIDKAQVDPEIYFLKDSYLKTYLAMIGVHNQALGTELWQIPIDKEFNSKLLEEVIQSISVENDVVKFYIPEFKSQYHEIYVGVVWADKEDLLLENIHFMDYTSTFNAGWNEFEIPEKICLIDIAINTRGKYLGGSSRGSFKFDCETGNVYNQDGDIVKQK